MRRTNDGSMIWALAAGLAMAAGVATPALAQKGDDVVVRAPAGGAARFTGVGTGQVSVKPDRVTLSLGVDVEAGTSAAAQAELNTRLAKVLAAIRGSGVQDQTVQTGSIRLEPVYVYDPPRDGQAQTPRLTGFRAASTVTVRTGDLANAARLIDAAVGAGGNRVEGVVFDLKDDSRARREALALATRNAREQAAVMAEALGLKLGRVVSAESGVRALPRPVPVAMFAKGAAEGGAALEAGEVTVMAEATVVFEAGG